MSDLARKRAVRAGHWIVITKLTKEADYLLHEDGQIEEVNLNQGCKLSRRCYEKN